MEVDITQKKYPFALEAETKDNHIITMDASKKSGGQGDGPTPMELLLSSLGGCATMEILNALNKAGFFDFRIKTKASAIKNEKTAHIESIHLKFAFEGDINPETATFFVHKGLEEHCTILNLLKKSTAISISTSFLF